MDNKKITDTLRALRKEAGMTQEEVANALNMERTFYTRIETGERIIRLQYIFSLAELYNMLPEAIIARMCGRKIKSGRLDSDVQDEVLRLQQELIELRKKEL